MLPGILNGDGGLICQKLHVSHIFLGEEIKFRMLDAYDADAFVTNLQQNRQLGLNLGNQRDIRLILAYITNILRFLGDKGQSRQSNL